MATKNQYGTPKIDKKAPGMDAPVYNKVPKKVAPKATPTKNPKSKAKPAKKFNAAAYTKVKNKVFGIK